MKKLIARLLLSFFALLIVLTIVEIVLRFIYDEQDNIVSQQGETPLHVVCDRPYLYKLNPDHPDISSQGFRDREFDSVKADGVFRILILGDSIAFGSGVSKDRAFPKILDKILNEEYGKAEVINAAVMGYTPYNELQFYLAECKKFEPDIVIVTFCMNDIVNPRLHWNYTQKNIPSIPVEAIPNLEYDKDHVLPIIEASWETARLNKAHPSLLMRSMIYCLIREKFYDKPSTIFSDEDWYVIHNNRQTPTFITGEDSISIQTLTEYDSNEWRWLRSIYKKLNRAVADDGGKLIIVVTPLSYQIDPSYPFIPQSNFARYSKESKIPSIDLLPEFRKLKNLELYLKQSDGYLDIWHLSEEGHKAAARIISDFLKTNKFLPK